MKDLFRSIAYAILYAALYLAVSAVVGVALTAMAEEASAETYLCVTDMTTGFDHKSSGDAEYKRFKGSKYIIKPFREYDEFLEEYTHEVVELGKNTPVDLTTLCRVRRDYISCDMPNIALAEISSFMMDKETGKFMLASFGTEWRSNKKNGHASEYIARGKCERID